jgi:hypothetical protein
VPEVVELPDSVMKLVLQVSVALEGFVLVVSPAGAVLLEVTVVDAVAVHPEAVLVAVTV